MRRGTEAQQRVRTEYLEQLGAERVHQNVVFHMYGASWDLTRTFRWGGCGHFNSRNSARLAICLWGLIPNSHLIEAKTNEKRELELLLSAPCKP